MLPEPLLQELRRLSTAQKLHAIELLAHDLAQSFPADADERDPEQAWFWTPEWQAKEREADDAIAQGNYQDFDSADDFINSL